MEVKENPVQPPIIDQLKEYANTRIKLVKYQSIEKLSSLLANVIANAIMVVCLILAFIFASITLACYLATVFKSNGAGFGCVTIIYLLIAVLVMFMKKGFEQTMINTFIKKFFN